MPQLLPFRKAAEPVPCEKPLLFQDGGLLALGITEVTVAVRPRVAILSTGDEVVEIESQSRKGLQAMQILIEELGGKGIQLISKCCGGC